MGSIGVMMAEWTVELFRSRKKKSKFRKEKKKKGKVSTIEAPPAASQDGVLVCSNCRENHKNQKFSADSKPELEGGQVYEEPLRQLQALSQERDRVSKLFVDFHDDIDEISDHEEVEQPTVMTLEQTVAQLIQQTKNTRHALQQSKDDCLRMAEGVGRQLAERDREHADRVKSLEIMMKEKEKQLLNASNILRQQLSDSKREIQMLERKQSSQQQLLARKNSEAQQFVAATRKTSEEHMAAVSVASAATIAAQKKLSNGSTGSMESLEQEVESLRLVLEMRRVEVEQLRAANNCLLLEMERCRGLELHVDEQRQRIEEMEAVIQNKNIEIRQLNEQRARLVQQLEIEESAHLSCQQDLERVEWTLQNIITAKDHKKDINIEETYEDKSIILDLVHKDKSMAYSITC